MSELSVLQQSSETRVETQEQLRDLLSRLHELAVVETHPLTLRLLPALPPSEDAVGVRVRVLLADLIERLKPDEDARPHALEWRQHVILRDRYLLRRPLREIEDKLALGERQMRREHQQAIASLATLLTPLLDRLGRTSADAPVAASLAEAVHRLSPAPRVFGLQQLLNDIVLAGQQTARALPVDARPVFTAHVEPSDLSVFTDRGILHQLLLKLTQFLMQFSTRRADIRFTGSWRDQGAGSPVQLRIKGEVNPLTPIDHDTLKLCALLAESLQSKLLVADDQRFLSVTLLLPAGERLHKILIVDDELPAAELFQSYLVGLRYETIVETKPENAVQRALEVNPDGIVLDIMMPAMDGWELLQRFRHTPGVADVPIIACSVINDAEMATALGATQFLRKPVLRSHLTRALEAVLA